MNYEEIYNTFVEMPWTMQATIGVVLFFLLRGVYRTVKGPVTVAYRLGKTALRPAVAAGRYISKIGTNQPRPADYWKVSSFDLSSTKEYRRTLKTYGNEKRIGELATDEIHALATAFMADVPMVNRAELRARRKKDQKILNVFKAELATRSVNEQLHTSRLAQRAKAEKEANEANEANERARYDEWVKRYEAEQSKKTIGESFEDLAKAAKGSWDGSQSGYVNGYGPYTYYSYSSTSHK